MRLFAACWRLWRNFNRASLNLSHLTTAAQGSAAPSVPPCVKEIV
jgi:hypothetical protein